MYVLEDKCSSEYSSFHTFFFLARSMSLSIVILTSVTLLIRDRHWQEPVVGSGSGKYGLVKPD